jgi:hypothetical protein
MPSANDDYSLSLSVPAIAPFVDEVLVYVDAADDLTDGILCGLSSRFPNLRVVQGRKNVGWCESRNLLMTLTDAQHLLFLDADDIFCEWQIDHLRQLPEIAKKADSGFMMLGLMEAVGDFQHGTGRGWSKPHYDKCHAYVNRSACWDLEWRHKNTFTYPFTAEKRSASRKVLFLHAKGVKSDDRLVWRGGLRERMRGTASDERPTDAAEIHRWAMFNLLKNKQNPLILKPHSVRLPILPENRFEIQYVGGVPIDRIDHGWRP